MYHSLILNHYTNSLGNYYVKHMRTFYTFQQWLLLAIVFFIPWQARWIFRPGTINGGVSEYTTLSIYATEVLLVVLLISLIIPLTRHLKKSERSVKSLLPIGIVIILIGWLLLSVGPWWPITLQKGTWLALGTSLALSIVILKPKSVYLYATIAAAGTIQALLALYQFFVQKVFASTYLGTAAQNPEILGTPVIIKNGIRSLRAFGSFPHPNMLGGFLVITLLATTWLIMQQKNKKLLFACYSLFVIELLGLLAAASRSALIGLVVALVFLYIYRRKNPAIKITLLKILLITGVIFTLVTFLQPQLVEQRLSLHNRIEQQSVTTRIAQLQQANLIMGNNWLQGIGLGLYPVALKTYYPDQPSWWYQPIHNTYVLIVSELGFIGIILIIALVGALYITNEHMKPTFKNHEILIGTSMLLALATIGIFDHYLWSFYTGIMMTSLAVGLTLKK